MLCLNEEFWSNQSYKTFGKSLSASKKHHVRFEVKFTKGDLEVFVNGESMGLAVLKNSILKNRTFFITCQNNTKSSVKLDQKEEPESKA